MKIIIEPGDMEEPEVIIRGRSGSEEVRQLLELLGGAGGISQIPLYAEEKEYFFKPEEICYSDQQKHSHQHCHGCFCGGGVQRQLYRIFKGWKDKAAYFQKLHEGF